MKFKSLLSFITAGILLIVSVVSSFAVNVPSICSVYSADDDLSIELYSEDEPDGDLVLEIDGKNCSVDEIIAGNDKNLTVCAYILIDVSTSMKNNFDTVKNFIKSFRNTFGSEDVVIPVIFGESTVKIQDNIKTVNEFNSFINGLKCDEQGTLFYEALIKTISYSQAKNTHYDREYMVVFSDGEDYQSGNSTFNEAYEKVKNSNLRIYGACTGFTTQETVDNFGEIARISGGDIVMYYNTTDYQTLCNLINSVYIIKSKIPSEFQDGENHSLSLKVNGFTVKKDVNISKNNNAMNVMASTDSNIPENNSVNSDLFMFMGIGLIIVFLLVIVIILVIGTRKQTGSNKVQNIVQKNSMLNQPRLQYPTYNSNGSAVPDNNIVKSNFIPVRDVREVRTTPKLDDVMHYSNDTESFVKSNQGEKAGKRIRLHVKTGNVSEQNIETVVIDNIIGGRAETCDLYIGDSKVSRLHFMIENINGLFYVMDLKSTNGTFLNGNIVRNSVEIKTGDVITAGLSDITVTVM